MLYKTLKYTLPDIYLHEFYFVNKSTQAVNIEVYHCAVVHKENQLYLPVLFLDNTKLCWYKPLHCLDSTQCTWYNKILLNCGHPEIIHSNMQHHIKGLDSSSEFLLPMMQKATQLIRPVSH